MSEMFKFTSLAQAKKNVINCMVAGITPMIHGHPAIGKSDLVKQIATEFDLELIDWRGSTADPTDLAGFPMLDGEKASYKPFDTFPVVGDKVPDGKKGFLLFMDEFNSAPRSVIAGAYKLILDKQVGSHALHPKVFIVAAGNLESSNAIVNNIGTAAQSRMVHLFVEPSIDEFYAWGVNNKVDHRILSCLKYKPDLLNNFNSESTDCTFAAPRTWNFLNKLLPALSKTDLREDLPLIAGTIGSEAAYTFIAYVMEYCNLPKLEHILVDPKGVRIPDEPGHLWLLSGMLSSSLTDKNVNEIITYANRMSVEFRVLIMSMAVKRDRSLITVDEFADWIGEFASDFV